MIQPVPCQAIISIHQETLVSRAIFTQNTLILSAPLALCQSESLSRVVWATVGCKHCDCGNCLVLEQCEGYHSCDNSNWIHRTNGSSGTSLTLHTYTCCSPFACRPSVRSICPTSPSASIDSFPVQPSSHCKSFCIKFNKSKCTLLVYINC